MILFPNCKLNLGLHILRKRHDGYHDLETIFYPVNITDCLEIIENREHTTVASIPLHITGLPVSGHASKNLCIKAYRLLKKDFPKLPSIIIHLHKVIPSGAGLGGGSANGSYTLMLLNKKFKLGLTEAQLIGYAAKLGSDCPLFILNKPCYGTGRGVELEPINVSLDNYQILVVHPGIHIDTGRAFLDIKPTIPERSLKEIITQPVEKWKYELNNDFEKILFKQHREVVDIKDELYTHGALYASMSGSGSTVYGIFPRDEKINVRFPEKYFVRSIPAGKQATGT